MMEQTKWFRLAPILLALVTFLSFSSALQNGFVYDDHFLIESNPYLKDFTQWKSLLLKELWTFSETMDTIYYRPVTGFTLLILYQSFGPNPVAFHLASILLHIIATLFLYKIFEHYAPGWPAFVGALIFGVHPVHVESVSWAAGINDPLGAVFLHASLLLWLRARIGFSVLPMLLAFFTKEPALFFPFVLAVDQFLFRRHSPKHFKIWAGVTVIVFLIALGLRLYALGSLIPVQQPLAIGFQNKLIAAVSFAGFYLAKLVLPLRLTAQYDVHLPLTISHALPGIVLFISAVVVGWLGRFNKPLLFGLVWFMILLSPSLMVSAVSASLFAERYLYLPSAGFCLALAAIAQSKLVQRIFLISAILLAAMTFSRSKVWKDDLTLWKDTVEKSPASATANYNLATAYMKNRNCKDAVHFFQRTVALDRSRAPAYYSMAVCQHRLGDDANAVRNLKQFLHFWDKDDAARQEALRKLRELEGK